MDRDRTSPGNDTKCLGYGIANVPKGSVDVRIHPQRIQWLTRRLERYQDELGKLRREAITSVEKTIEILGSQQPGMTDGVARSLLSELKGASTFSVGALFHPGPSERSHPAEKVANLGLGDPVPAEEGGSPLTPKILALIHGPHEAQARRGLRAQGADQLPRSS